MFIKKEKKSKMETMGKFINSICAGEMMVQATWLILLFVGKYIVGKMFCRQKRGEGYFSGKER